MKLTEEEIEKIILEETVKYLEEVGRLSPKELEKVMKHIPFTKQHRQADKEERKEQINIDVYMMVIGGSRLGAAYTKWPTDENEKNTIVSWLINTFPDITG